VVVVQKRNVHIFSFIACVRKETTWEHGVEMEEEEGRRRERERESRADLTAGDPISVLDL
jgi:hypothetical protein